MTMSYSELANWDGSLDRLNAQKAAAAARASANANNEANINSRQNGAYSEPDPAAYIIPQHEIDEFIAADDADCASEKRDERARAVARNSSVIAGTSESEEENEVGSERSEDDNDWDALDRHTNASRGMETDSSTPIRVHRKKRRRDTDGIVESVRENETVISRNKESNPATPIPTLPAVDRNADSTAHGQAGASNPPSQNNTRLKSGSVKRTYIGPRRMKDASEPSGLAKPASSVSGPSTDAHRIAEPARRLQHDSEAPSGSRDAAVDALRLESKGISSRTPTRKVSKANENSSGSSRSRSTDGHPTSSKQQRKTNEHAKNPFYASLTSAINGQRRQALHHATLLGKSSKSHPSSSKSSPPETRPATQHSKRKDRADRSPSVCVLIPPYRFPVPREMFKSVDEHIAEEEEAQRKRKKERKRVEHKVDEKEQDEEHEGYGEDEEERRRRKERRKERRREWMKQKQLDEVRSKHEQTAAKNQGKQKLAVGPSKRNQSMTDAIYVSSGTEGATAGPSRTSSASKKRVTSPAKRRVEDEDVAPIPIVSSSGDEYIPSDPVSSRKISTRSKSLTKRRPKSPARALRKKREEIVVSSDSENDVVLVENALEPSPSPRRQPRRKASMPTPLRMLEGQNRPVGRKRTDVGDKDDDETNQKDTNEVARPVEDVSAKDVNNISGTPRADALKSSSISREDVSATEISKNAELARIVVKPGEQTLPTHNRSTQPRSPTLCLPGTPSHNISPSPSSRSTTLAAPEEPSTSKPPDAPEDELSPDRNKAWTSPEAVISKDVAVVGLNAGEEGTASASEDDESRHEGEVDSESGSSSDELDETCHRCRNRNIYAKMKCVKVKIDRKVCPLRFCHRCIIVFFPKVEFDPWSVSFVCPACVGTCDCIGCCKKRGDNALEQHRINRVRAEDLGVILLLSPQETRRRERAAMGKPVEPKRVKSRSLGATKTESEKPKVDRPLDIGKEAEDWIRKQSIGKRKVRAFVGAWQDSWGPAPFCVHEMDGIDFDAHAATGMGKGKGKAVDSSVRLYVGDRAGLDRPFERAEDVIVSVRDREPSPPPKKRPGRPKKRKPESGDVIHVAPADIPDKKKRRRTDQITIPEFTMNHQDATSSNATSPFYHPTPDDLRPLHGLEINEQAKYPGVTNDPMLGAVNGPYGSDPLEADMYAPDWDSVAMPKPLPAEGFSGADFSYQGTYDSYAAVLGGSGSVGMDQYDYANALRIGKQDETGQTAPGLDQHNALTEPREADKDLTQLIDPALIETGHDSSKLSGQDLLEEIDNSDPTRFLTPHARASSTPTLLSAPMIYGVPSSTGLSLHDLQRTMRESLSALACSLS